MNAARKRVGWGRAVTDPGPHGRRRTYQGGCPCPACRAANTAYSARYRQAQRAGRPVLGARAPAREALKVVKVLLAEGYRRADIARGLGHQPNRPWPELAIGRQGAAVTWRTVYRLRAFLRRVDRLDDAHAFLQPPTSLRPRARRLSVTVETSVKLDDGSREFADADAGATENRTLQKRRAARLGTRPARLTRPSLHAECATCSTGARRPARKALMPATLRAIPPRVSIIEDVAVADLDRGTQWCPPSRFRTPHPHRDGRGCC